MNPCNCGYHNDLTHECKCSPAQIQRYISKISGPLLDRIDIHIDVPAVKVQELCAQENGEAPLTFAPVSYKRALYSFIALLEKQYTAMRK